MRMCCNERHILLLKYVITFLRYIRMVRRELLAASKSTLWSTWCQFCQKWLSNCVQNIGFWHPLCMGNGMTWYDVRYTLLLECFVTFLRCIRMNGRAYDRVQKPYMIHTVSFLQQQQKTQILCKIPAFGDPLFRGNGLMCFKEGHPLLLECFITFLG